MSSFGGKKTADRHVVFIYHDETTFFANHAPSRGWDDDMGSRQQQTKGLYRKDFRLATSWKSTMGSSVKQMRNFSVHNNKIGHFQNQLQKHQ